MEVSERPPLSKKVKVLLALGVLLSAGLIVALTLVAMSRLRARAQGAPESIDERLTHGLRDLEDGHYREAFDRFKYVVAHSKADRTRRAKIEEAVLEINQRKRLFRWCQERWKTRSVSVIDDGVLDALLVLGSYLPLYDPSRSPSRELYKKVKEQRTR